MSNDETTPPTEFIEHIDLEVAKRFLENPDEIDLTMASTIDDDAAGVLAKYQGDLFFESLTSLSDAAAQALSQHQGGLWLYGLTELSDATAKFLSKPKGALNLDSEIELSDEATGYLLRALREGVANNELDYYISNLDNITIDYPTPEWEISGDTWSQTFYGNNPDGQVKIEFYLDFNPNSIESSGCGSSVLTSW